MTDKRGLTPTAIRIFLWLEDQARCIPLAAHRRHGYRTHPLRFAMGVSEVPRTDFDHVSQVRREPLSSIGLRKLREDAGLGLREAANFIGISPATLSRIETSRDPDVHTAIKVARFYETTVEELWGKEQP